MCKIDDQQSDGRRCDAVEVCAGRFADSDAVPWRGASRECALLEQYALLYEQGEFA